MKRNAKGSNGRSVNPLAIAALIVLAAALIITILPRLSGKTDGSDGAAASAASSGDLVVRAEEIGTQASYFDRDVDGVTVQVLAVRASDGTVRLALNTCQVCNGSPHAYFEQDGDDFVCQNCHNRFSSTDIGTVSGGCDPVPITAEIYREEDGALVIPLSFLEENAARFTNWKKF